MGQKHKKIYIVLGKNWIKKGRNPVLSPDSIISVLALGYTLQLDTENRHIIIFSTGFTGKNNRLSEAAAMYEFFLRKFPAAADKHAVYLEENSIDTYQNAEEVKKIYDNLALEGEVYLITVAYHMARSRKKKKKIFKEKFNEIRSDEIIFNGSLNIGEKDLVLIEQRQKDLTFLFWEPIKEICLRLLLIFDRQGKMVRLFTNFCRRKQYI